MSSCSNELPDLPDPKDAASRIGLTAHTYMIGFDSGIFCLTRNKEPIEELDLNKYPSTHERFNAGQHFYRRCLGHGVDIMQNKKVMLALFSDVKGK